MRVCPKRKKPALPAAGKVVARIPLGATAGSLAAGDGAVWSTLFGTASGDPVAVRIDPASNGVTARAFAPSSQFYDLGVGFGSLWISNFDDDSVTRYDDTTGALVGTVGLNPGTAPEGVAFANGSVWVAGHHGNPTGSVVRIDPSTDAVTARIAAGAAQGCCGPQEITFGAGALWVGVPNQHRVVRVDPTSASVTANIAAGPSCGGLAADDTAVWVAYGCDGLTVARIDPRTNAAVARVPLPAVPDDPNGGPAGAGGVTIAFGSVWAVSAFGKYGELVQIDPATNRAVAALRIAAGEGSVVAADGDLWVGSGRNVLRIHPRP